MTNMMRILKWDAMSQRVIGIYGVFGLGLISSLIVLVLATCRLTIIRITLGGLIVAAWGFLYLTHQSVDEWRTLQQVRVLLPRFRQAERELRNWPKGSGSVPVGGLTYAHSTKYPNLLMLAGTHDWYPVHEDFGLKINRDYKGILRFDLIAAYGSCVEFHPHGSVPTAYMSGFGNPSPPVASVTRLEANWFLVRYGEQ